MINGLFQVVLVPRYLEGLNIKISRAHAEPPLKEGQTSILNGMRRAVTYFVMER